MNKENIGNGKVLPEKKFSTGAISAIIWKNNVVLRTGEATEFRTINIQRSYKDKDGNWQSTNSLRVSDLPKAVLVLNKAYEYLVLRQEIAKGLEGKEEEVVM